MRTEVSAPDREYEERLRLLESRITGARRRRNWCLWSLAGSATCMLLVFYLGLQLKVIPFVPSALGLLLLAAMFWRQMSSSMRSLVRARCLQQHYQLCQDRLSHRWMGRGRTGEEYLDDSHLYSADLDLFGTGSVFELMCTTITGAGRDTLARWLTEPADRETALKRQAAVEELRNRLDLRETLVLCGAGVYSDCQTETFSRWLDSPPVNFPWWARLTALVMALTTPAIPALVLTGVVGSGVLLPVLAQWFAIELLFAAIFEKPIRKTLEDIQMPSLDLNLFQNILRMIERRIPLGEAGLPCPLPAIQRTPGVWRDRAVTPPREAAGAAQE